MAVIAYLHWFARHQELLKSGVERPRLVDRWVGKPKAANDNHMKDAAAMEELWHELRDLKNGVGFKRAVGK